MKREKQLFWARNVFAFIVFVTLGVIVVTEKAKEVLIPKVQEKMEEYIETNYPDIKEEVNLEKITVSNKVYTMKVSSKKNENWFFYLTYKNKKITDSYQKDIIYKQETPDSFVNNAPNSIYLGLISNNSRINILNNSKIIRNFNFIDYLKSGVTIK